MLVRRKTMERMLLDQQRRHERDADAWMRERRDLLDRIMYMADRPWSPPPTPPPVEQPEIEWPMLPEQLTPDEVVMDGSQRP